MTRPSSFKKPAAALLIALGILAICAVIVMPWIKTLYDPAMRDAFTAFVESIGIWGYVLMFAIQVLQVVIAIIPGEPVELMAGVLYGGFGGLILCLTGCIAGSGMIFTLMRRLGQPVLDRIFRKKKLQEYSFLKDSRKLDAVTFILFLMPGTPKDMLTYIAGTTPMPLMRFLAISTFARIPSVVTSTYIGDSFLAGNWYTAAILLIVTLILGLTGIFCRERVMAFCHRHSPKNSRSFKRTGRRAD